MFIPYHSERGTVDLTAADAEFVQRLERARDKMRRITTRWVPSLQFIQERRPEMHWCSYDDGRVTAFCELKRDETFGDFQEIYDFVAQQVMHLRSLGNYKGEFVDQPNPEDETDVHWRKWHFKAGDSTLVLNVGFSLSQHCKVIVEGEETVTVTKKRVVCGEEIPQAA